MSTQFLRVLRRGRELSRLWNYPTLPSDGDGYQAGVVEYVRLALGLTPVEAAGLRLAFLPGDSDHSDGATLTAYGATLAIEVDKAKPAGDASSVHVRDEGRAKVDFDFVACWVASVGVGARASDLALDLADGDRGDGGEL